MNNFGFNQQLYTNNYTYVANTSINLGDNVYYLMIENLNENNPLFLIKEGVIENINQLDEEQNVDYLVIKFYKTKKNIVDNNLEYSHFFDNNHKIEFIFNYI